MIKNSNFKAFSLLELIIVLGVIVFLGLLGFLAVGTARRSSREAERKANLNAINYELTDYYGNKSAYPKLDTILIDRVNDTITIGRGGRVIELNGAAAPLSNKKATESTEQGSVYCYTPIGNNYALAIRLESGDWFNLGNADVPCKAANI